MEVVGSMSIWYYYNHFFTINIDWRPKKYLREKLNVHLVSDITKKDTNRPFRRSDWYDFIEEEGEDRGVQRTNAEKKKKDTPTPKRESTHTLCSSGLHHFHGKVK